MKRIIILVIKWQDTIMNTVFVAGLLMVIWAGVKVLTAPGVPCFGF